MKRIYLTLALIGLIGLGTSVVGGPNASDGEMAITSGSSASASASVGPNGTEYKTTIENLNNSCSTGNQSTGMDFIGFQGNGEMTELSFEGVVNTANPCTEIGLETEEISDNVYQVELVEKSTGQGPCVQCVGNAEFSGSFSAPGEYKVEFVKNNQSLGIQETSEFNQTNSEDTNSKNSKNSGLKSFLNWLSSFL